MTFYLFQNRTNLLQHPINIVFKCAEVVRRATEDSLIWEVPTSYLLILLQMTTHSGSQDAAVSFYLSLFFFTKLEDTN